MATSIRSAAVLRWVYMCLDCLHHGGGVMLKALHFTWIQVHTIHSHCMHAAKLFTLEHKSKPPSHHLCCSCLLMLLVCYTPSNTSACVVRQSMTPSKLKFVCRSPRYRRVQGGTFFTQSWAPAGALSRLFTGRMRTNTCKTRPRNYNVRQRLQSS